MKYRKQVIGQLEKCYALSTVTVDGQSSLLVAAEKHNPCWRFDLSGNRLDTVWEEPGGIMTMVPVPGMENAFLATHKFYSPNDSAQAILVCAKREEGQWNITKIADLPFVHRFDIIPSGGVNYVLACTLKSGHEYKNDWRFPGKLWVGILPEDPARPLELSVLKEGLTHNHGYTRFVKDGRIHGIVSCDEGVFQVTPPEKPGMEWKMECLLEVACSDTIKIDLDGDGEEELFTISPFHGDTISIWHKADGGFEKVYQYPEPLPFLHAIYGGSVCDRPTVYAGNREGDRLFAGFWFDRVSGAYRVDVVDRGAGPANCMLFERDGHPALLASNRETDEIAIYDIDPDGTGEPVMQ